MKNKHLKLEKLYNVRDLGGYHTLESKITKDYKYIRGTAKGTLLDKEKEDIYQLGIRVIIDLRYGDEIIKTPHPLKGYKDIKYYNVDIVGSFKSMVDGNYEDIADLYKVWIDQSKDKFKEVFKIFLNHLDEGIFFNCTAGKDRTGIIAYLLLSLALVSKQDIIDNYSESYQNNLKRPSYQFVPKEQHKYLYSKPLYMEKLIDYVNKNYQNPINYLKEIGLEEIEIETLKNNFLE
ncbi:tyrosine-protein phosphatase [Acholeplasma sp. OttesenSCG-928-E16]|nr:tyrosine-protein phosphatase [Acholeplasma sp. OttesenSCG-928-E16]